MIEHEVRTHPSSARLAREDQLAWKLAAVAAWANGVAVRELEVIDVAQLLVRSVKLRDRR